MISLTIQSRCLKLSYGIVLADNYCYTEGNSKLYYAFEVTSVNRNKEVFQFVRIV